MLASLYKLAQAHMDGHECRDDYDLILDYSCEAYCDRHYYTEYMFDEIANTHKSIKANGLMNWLFHFQQHHSLMFIIC